MLEALVWRDRAGLSVVAKVGGGGGGGGGIISWLGRRSMIVAMLAEGVALRPDESAGSPAPLVPGALSVALGVSVVAPLFVVAFVASESDVLSVCVVVPSLPEEFPSSLVSLLDGFFLVPTMLIFSFFSDPASTRTIDVSDVLTGFLYVEWTV